LLGRCDEKVKEWNDNDQGCQNQDFASGRKGRVKLKIVKSELKSKDFTQLFL